MNITHTLHIYGAINDKLTEYFRHCCITKPFFTQSNTHIHTESICFGGSSALSKTTHLVGCHGFSCSEKRYISFQLFSRHCYPKWLKKRNITNNMSSFATVFIVQMLNSYKSCRVHITGSLKQSKFLKFLKKKANRSIYMSCPRLGPHCVFFALGPKKMAKWLNNCVVVILLAKSVSS